MCRTILTRLSPGVHTRLGLTSSERSFTTPCRPMAIAPVADRLSRERCYCAPVKPAIFAVTIGGQQVFLAPLTD